MKTRADAIEALHEQYSGILYDLCVRMLGDRSEAEDAVQETFVNAFRAWHRFEGDRHLPWLWRIATNTCLKFIRTRKRKGTALLEQPDFVAAAGSDPVRGLGIRHALEQIVGDLDERGQYILVAHFVHGMGQGEIADQLGVSRRAVVKRLTAMRTRYLPVLKEVETYG